MAVIARNCKLTSGRLDPIRGLLIRHTATQSLLRTIYRYRFNGSDYWLTWASQVHVAPSPVADDAFGRFYFTGDGEARMSTFAKAIQGGDFPSECFVLGVVAPVNAPMVTPSGGSGSNEDRSYCYAFRTPLGEVGGPSPATLATGKPDGTWTVAGMDVAPPNSGTVLGAVRNTPSAGVVRVTLNTVVGLRAGEVIRFSGVGGMTDLNQPLTLLAVGAGTVDVLLTTSQSYTGGGSWARQAPHNVVGMTKRIYRTIAGEFRLVAEVPVATTTYADTRPSTEVALEDALEALVLPPPVGLRNLAVLANGAMVGIAGNKLCFSDLNKPHSWPLSNRYAFAGEGVALTVVGNSVILLTDSFPIVATATVPEAVNLVRSTVYAPCVSEAGTVDNGEGAIYPSFDGLYLVTPGGARNLTENLYRLDEWKALFPQTFIAAYHDQTYVAGHASLVAPLSRVFTLDLTTPDGTIDIDTQADVLYANPLDGKLYLVQGNAIFEWDADHENPMTGYWQSRTYQLGSDTNFSVFRVHAELPKVELVTTRLTRAQQLQLQANIAAAANPGNVDGELAAAEVGVYSVTGSALAPLGRPVPPWSEEDNIILMFNPDDVDGELADADVNSFEIAGSAIRPVTRRPNVRVDFQLIANGEVVHTAQVTDSGADRLPAGFLENVYAVGISFSAPVYSVAVANDLDELTADFA